MPYTDFFFILFQTQILLKVMVYTAVISAITNSQDDINLLLPFMTTTTKPFISQTQTWEEKTIAINLW